MSSKKSKNCNWAWLCPPEAQHLRGRSRNITSLRSGWAIYQNGLKNQKQTQRGSKLEMSIKWNLVNIFLLWGELLSCLKTQIQIWFLTLLLKKSLLLILLWVPWICSGAFVLLLSGFFFLNLFLSNIWLWLTLELLMLNALFHIFSYYFLKMFFCFFFSSSLNLSASLSSLSGIPTVHLL
jgi:hypothetical protein